LLRFFPRFSGQPATGGEPPRSPDPVSLPGNKRHVRRRRRLASGVFFDFWKGAPCWFLTARRLSILYPKCKSFLTLLLLFFDGLVCSSIFGLFCYQVLRVSPVSEGPPGPVYFPPSPFFFFFSPSSRAAPLFGLRFRCFLPFPTFSAGALLWLRLSWCKQSWSSMDPLILFRVFVSFLPLCPPPVGPPST